MHKIAIVIRCHAHPELVLDTVDALFHYCTTNPLIVLSVDRNLSIGPVVRKAYPQVVVYDSPVKCNWGAGLYYLFAETVKFLEKRYEFEHVMSLDYDCVPLKEGCDKVLLDQIDLGVGLLGKSDSLDHWHKIIEKCRSSLHQNWKIKTAKGSFNRSVLGALMLMTRECLENYKAYGMLDLPYHRIKDWVPCVDDIFIAAVTQLLGFKVKDVGDLGYLRWGRPTISVKEAHHKKNMYWFHPIKQFGGIRTKSGSVDRAAELEARNYLRMHRGLGPI